MKYERPNPVLTTSLIALAALGIASMYGQRTFVINTSPSVAPGLYVRSTGNPAVGQIVDFCIPLAARQYIFSRTGHKGDDWYILKPIAAGPGDQVNTMGDWLVIDGRQIAPMPPLNDRGGRSLPVWRGSRVLGPDEFFVFSDRIPNSFDSRCYGPIRRQEIDSIREPWITW